MSNHHALVWTALVAAMTMTMTACGQTPSAPPRVAGAALAPPAPRLPDGPAAPVQDAQVQQLRANLASVYATLPGLSAQIETFDRGPSAQESNTIRIAYRRPYTMKIEMLKASGTADGARIVWTGGDTLRIKPRFLPLAVDKRIDDTQTVSKNGWTIRHTGVHAIFDVLLDPAAQVRSLGNQVLAGRPVTALAIQSKRSPSGTTQEVIALDGRGLPASRSIYRGEALVYRALITSLTVRALEPAELSL